MPPEVEAKRYRQGQLALRSATLRELLQLWPAFDVERLAKTWPSFEAGALALVREAGSTSAELTVRYYERARARSRARGAATSRLASVSADEALAGLRAVGLERIGSQLSRARPLDQIRKAALVNLSGEVTRLVLNAGRSTLAGSLLEDAKRNHIQTGVQRLTSGDACQWCQDQTGTTYRPTEAFPAHMHCGCCAVAVFH